jgi:nucleotide-binding universal stress UspA family protein
MGAHGRGLFGRSVIGSVAKKILRGLDVPVVIVRPLVRVPAFGRILFATDLSEPSRRGLYLALELAQITRSNVVTLNAVDVGLEGGAEAAVYLGERSLQEALAKLQEFKTDAPQQNFEINAVLAEGSIAGTIIKTAAQKSIDLIAIAVSSRGDASVAETLINDSPVPVLAIPVRELRNEKSPAEPDWQWGAST